MDQDVSMKRFVDDIVMIVESEGVKINVYIYIFKYIYRCLFVFVCLYFLPVY